MKGLAMGFVHAVGDGPVAFDRLVQRAVNAGMFALMRAGASKSFIRYALGVAVIVCGLGGEFCRFRANGGTSIGRTIFTVIILFLVVRGQGAERKIDDSEEAVGIPVGNLRSSGFSRFLWWLFLIVDLLCLAKVIDPTYEFAAHVELWFRYEGAQTAFDVSILLRLYSALTPPRPPRREARAVLVPARSS